MSHGTAPPDAAATASAKKGSVNARLGGRTTTVQSLNVTSTAPSMESASLARAGVIPGGKALRATNVKSSVRAKVTVAAAVTASRASALAGPGGPAFRVNPGTV